MTDLKMLRKQLCVERAKLTAEFQQRAAEKVAKCICDTEVFQKSNNIAAYLAFNGEMDPAPVLAQAWDMGKNCYLPMLAPEKNLKFALYNEGDPLVDNHYGIPEPYADPEKIIAPEDLDLIIVPLVGFDVDCNRLGMGGGYYDRTFAFTKNSNAEDLPFLMGIAYEFQNMSQIDKEPWDVPLNMIVTEIQTRRF